MGGALGRLFMESTSISRASSLKDLLFKEILMTDNSNSEAPELKQGDRVIRKGGEGCQGEVVSVRAEVTSSTGSTDEKGLLVNVQWDNGTYSYFTPTNLERVS